MQFHSLTEDDNEEKDKDTNLEVASFCGAAYGLKIPNLSPNHPVILNATGTLIPPMKPDAPLPNVEFLTEVFHCGLDPVGVVRLADDDSNEIEEDEERIGELLSYLPVSSFV